MGFLIWIVAGYILTVDDCEDFCLRLLDKLDAEDVRFRVIVYYNKMDFKLNSLGKREIRSYIVVF